ncbi:hypothetical protein BGZ73_000645 [Actinomortierella ambigua]|nr:hypothetical protein BGZ73_000645 [Actinomortierella ambigua]
MSSSEPLPDVPAETAASPIIFSTTPVTAAAAATIAATTTTTSGAAPESMDDRATARLSPSAAVPTPSTFSSSSSPVAGSQPPMSETSSSPLLLLSTSFLPSSTTSLPSQLEKQPQAQYLRAPPPPSLHAPSPTPSSIRSVGVSVAPSTAANRPQSVAHIGTALWNDASARRMRVNVLDELSTGWVHLSTSSRVLILYYTIATLIEIIVTTTILVLERAHIRTCIYLVVFLILYLIRAVTINFFLLRKFLWTRPDDLPISFTGAVGAQTMINWASLILVLFSIAVLTTQSECSKESPALFFLVLTFSLLGYMCASALLLIWIGILFCMHGFLVLLELFHVGPTAMRWQGAQEDLISKVPVVRFKKGASAPVGPEVTTEVAGVKEKEEGRVAARAAVTLSSSSCPSSESETHGPASTFTVTITSPDSEQSSRRHTTELGRSSPPLDTIHESKQELTEGEEVLPSPALETKEETVARPVTADQQLQALPPRQQLQDRLPGKSEIVIEIPLATVSADGTQGVTESAEAADETEPRPAFAFGEGYQPDAPSPTTTVIQLPDVPPQQQQQHRRPLEPMATMTIEEGQGVFVDGELVQEGTAEMISSRCSICLCEYEDEEELRHMPCNHFFHRECLDEWLKLKRTCPLCKYDIQDLNRFSKRLSWKRHQHHRRRSSAAASTTTNSSRNGRSSLNLWRRSQS